MPLPKLVYGTNDFIKANADVARRNDPVSGQRQIDCIAKWKEENPAYKDNIVLTWHGKQPNYQLVHTFDCRTLHNDYAAELGKDPNSGILINGRFWASVENYYQTKKIEMVRRHYPELKQDGVYGAQVDKAILKAREQSPKDAFNAARTELPNGKKLNDYIKSAMQSGDITPADLRKVMEQADLQKFCQFSELKQQLLEVKQQGAMIVEASPRDEYWGIKVANGKAGANLLGEVLSTIANSTDIEKSLEEFIDIGYNDIADTLEKSESLLNNLRDETASMHILSIIPNIIAHDILLVSMLLNNNICLPILAGLQIADAALYKLNNYYHNSDTTAKEFYQTAEYGRYVRNLAYVATAAGAFYLLSAGFATAMTLALATPLLNLIIDYSYSQTVKQAVAPVMLGV